MKVHLPAGKILRLRVSIFFDIPFQTGQRNGITTRLGTRSRAIILPITSHDHAHLGIANFSVHLVLRYLDALLHRWRNAGALDPIVMRLAAPL